MRVALFALAFSLAACGQSTNVPAVTAEPAPPPPAAAVTEAALTSQGFGALQIGAAPPTEFAPTGPAATTECVEYHPDAAPAGLNVMLQEGRIARISLVRDATLKTDHQLGVGASAADVRAAYPTGLFVSPHKYQAAPAEYLTHWDRGAPAAATDFVTDTTARGVRYEVGAAGAVIAVHAGGPAIQNVEGCA